MDVLEHNVNEPRGINGSAKRYSTKIQDFTLHLYARLYHILRTSASYRATSPACVVGCDESADSALSDRRPPPASKSQSAPADRRLTRDSR